MGAVVDIRGLLDRGFRRFPVAQFLEAQALDLPAEGGVEGVPLDLPDFPPHRFQGPRGYGLPFGLAGVASAGTLDQVASGHVDSRRAG